jgi:hypothetical protein
LRATIRKWTDQPENRSLRSTTMSWPSSTSRAQPRGPSDQLGQRVNDGTQEIEPTLGAREVADNHDPAHGLQTRTISAIMRRGSGTTVMT